MIILIILLVAISVTTGENNITECGIRPLIQANGSSVKQFKIINGKDSRPGEWPWHVAINVTPSRDQYLCSGSLLTPNFIITAAHCYFGNKYVYNITLGDTDTSNTLKEPLPSITRNASRVTQHGEYSDAYENTYNDVALMMWEESVMYMDHIRPICLPKNNDTYEGVDAWVTGWGWNGSKHFADVLQSAMLTVHSNAICQKLMNHSSYASMIFLCAGGDGHKAFCGGDSGGPLVTQRPDKHWELIGVVSAGPEPCAQLNHPGIFMRVTYFKEWILTTMKTMRET